MVNYHALIAFLPSWRVPVVNKLGLLARSVGMGFHSCKEPNEVFEVLNGSAKGSPVIVFVDSESLDFVRQLNKDFPACNVVLLLTTRLQSVADEVSSIRNINCLVANHDKDFDARDILITLKKFQEENILGLEKYLGYGAESRECVVTSDVDKKNAINDLHEFVFNLGGDGGKFSEYARRTSELVDELILNGVFNANPRFRGLDRQDPFVLEPHETIGLKYGFDGEYFGVAVRDPFGMLTRETILQYLNEATVTEKVSERDSGGLGLKVIFDRLHRFVVNVTPGNVTEAICLLRFENRIKDFDKRLRSFYYFAREKKAS